MSASSSLHPRPRPQPPSDSSGRYTPFFILRGAWCFRFARETETPRATANGETAVSNVNPCVKGLKCRLCGKQYPAQPLNFSTDGFVPREVEYDYSTAGDASR